MKITHCITCLIVLMIFFTSCSVDNSYRIDKGQVGKLKSIQIFNPIYKTEKGICLLSTFKDVKENYMINKVETTLTSAMLYIDELNATIAIDKEEMGLHKFSREEISLDQIPDVSKIKYFTIWFN